MIRYVDPDGGTMREYMERAELKMMFGVNIRLKPVTLQKPFNVAGEWWVLMPPKNDNIPTLLKLNPQKDFKYGKTQINYCS